MRIKASYRVLEPDQRCQYYNDEPFLYPYNFNIFGKSTIGYATWLVAGIIVAEGITGTLSDSVWNSVNAGRTFETVDWTKFVSDDDDDDEDEEEEEEGEEEEEDDE